ncbi:MAG: hypothetical protein FJ388_15775, partial [Verrucomicrobia bacterium]|nr:hypothetical protein [Verrucomicrobiota bacterium]
MSKTGIVVRLARIAAVFCVSPILVLQAAEPVAIWDTVRHSNSSLSADQIAQRSGWKKVEGEAAKLAGDVCVANEYVVLVFRKGARGVECYYRLGDMTAKVMELVPVSGRGARARRLESCKVIRNAPDQALLEARFSAASGSRLAVRYLLRQGKPFLETQAGEDTRRIWIEAKTKYAVLPDLFAGDLVV